MNYRHDYHAGNFADVHKHLALVGILLHLKRKDAPFRVIDTHAGRGCYELNSAEALRTGEAKDGIARLVDHAPKTDLLASYLQTVRAFLPDRYPGSPLIAARMLRSCDRLLAMERDAEEYTRLCDTLRRLPNARAMCADGYARLSSLVPPPERRGVVLMDPPYEDASERQLLAKTFSQAYRRFATGAYLLWHPLKSAAPAKALAGEIKAAGASKVLSLAFHVGRTEHDGPERLSSSGLLVVNPPYGFDAEMEAAQSELLSVLRRSGEAKADVQWLVRSA